MLQNNHDIEERIDLYLTGKMTEEERLRFEDDLKTDNGLAEFYELQKLVISAIMQSRKDGLKQYITDNLHNVHSPKAILRGRFIWGLAAAACMAMVFFFLSEPGSFTENFKETKSKILSYKPFKNNIEKIPELDSSVQYDKEKPLAEADGSANGLLSEGIKDSLLADGRISKGKLNRDSMGSYKGNDISDTKVTTITGDFTIEDEGENNMLDSTRVLYDKFISDTILYAENLTPAEQNFGGNSIRGNRDNDYYNNQRAAPNKSLPGAVDNNSRGAGNYRQQMQKNETKEEAKNKAVSIDKLEKESSEAGKIKVELWSSPIRYMGYKFFKNTLVLYGIPKSDINRIYLSENIYYLETEKNIYQLREENIFNKFIPVNTRTMMKSNSTMPEKK